MMMNFLLRIVLSAGVLLLQGCITAKKYRLNNSGSTPTELNWGVSASGQTLTLKNLIVFKGPGSWKQAARWDEYIVQWTNGGAQPVTIDSAVLVDLLDAPQVPGTNPWTLEKLSYTNWDRYGRSGLNLLAGAGLVTVYTGLVVATATASLGGAAVGGAALLMIDVIPPLAALDIALVAVRNHHNKTAVETEFQRRRLVIPFTIAAGTSVTGSLFFPMTPAPRRMILRGPESVELSLELKPLAGLHLKPAVEKPKPVQ